MLAASLVAPGTLVSTSLPSFAEEPSAAGDYARLIDDLGSGDFHTRQRAEAALVAAGLAADQALAQAALDEDLEIRTRVSRLRQHVEQLRLSQTPAGWKPAWTLSRTAVPNFYNLDPWASSGVLLAEDDHRLKAFDAADGRPLWDAPLFGALGNAVPLIQAADAGFVFFTENHNLELIDPRTGQKRWTVDLQFTPQQWFVQHGLAIAGDRRRIVAISLDDGEFVYQREVEGQHSPIACDAERIITWSQPERKIGVRRLRDGEPIVAWATNAQLNGVVHLDRERIVFLDAARENIVACRLSDGESLWKGPLDLAGAPHQTYFWTWFASDPEHLAAPGLLWAISDGTKRLDRPLAGPKVDSLRPGDRYGAAVRYFPVPPTAAGDVVYYPGLNGQVTAVNTSDCSVRWTWQIGPGQGYRLLLLGDKLIASTDQRIVCLQRDESAPGSVPVRPLIVAEKPERERP